VAAGTPVDGATIRAWLEGTADAVHRERDRLTQLDAAIGDGDHGTNLDRGFTAVREALAGQPEDTPPGKLLITAGKTLISKVGGASGPLWGTALRRAGRVLGDEAAVDGPKLVDALDAALGGVVELGAAAPGDATMVDALTPAVARLREQLDAGVPLGAAVAAAADAADEGARSTVPMQARKGRASYLGERSVGHQDPGATSVVLVVQALAAAVAEPG
jgi:dihydroxyacetone kinase-like protein